jgi:arsenate reductase
MESVFHAIKIITAVKVFDFKQNLCYSIKMIFICNPKEIYMRLFYYLSSCDTCKRIAKELPLNDSITQVDIKKNPLTATQIEDLYQRTGSYEQLINKRARLYKQRNLKDKNLQEDDFRNLLLAHYTFLKRPLVVFDDHIFIGNGAQTVADAKAFLNEQ